MRAEPEYPSIAGLAARAGASVPCAGNLPVKLDDPDSVWFIDQGAVDLFLVEFKDGVERAAPQHLLRREAGTLLPGVAPDEQDDDKDTQLSLIAKGLPDTLLKRLPASLLNEVQAAELADQIDTWLIAVTDKLSRFATYLPHPTVLAETRSDPDPGPLHAIRKARVVWVSEPSRGQSLFMGMIDQAGLAGAGGPHRAAIPLTRTSWLTVLDTATVSGSSTETLVRQGRLPPMLAYFHSVAFASNASTACWPWSTMQTSNALA